ncbi:MAG: RsmE family RNA methyltransferase [Alphaproteobacteria bacterium]
MTIRLFVDQSLKNTSQEVLPSIQQQHYLLRVMRLQEGDRVFLFNGKDGEWEAECLQTKQPKKMHLQLLSQVRKQPTQSHAFFLFFAPIKTARMDMLIEKATELGVTHFLPCITDRTTQRHLNLERFQRISFEACEQSQRLDVPHFFEPAPLFKQLTKQIIQAPEHLFWMVPPSKTFNAPPFLQALQSFVSNTSPSAWGTLVGPEGGWSEKELQQLQQSYLPTLIPASLGTQILRAETAACLALGMLNQYVQAMDSTKSPKIPSPPS